MRKISFENKKYVFEIFTLAPNLDKVDKRTVRLELFSSFFQSFQSIMSEKKRNLVTKITNDKNIF